MFQFEIEEAVVDGKAVGEHQGKDIEVNFKVEERIRCDQDFGVIKYIGAVGSHPGNWLGIEWDNPARGKHNGNVDNVEYFNVSVPNAASFIRPAKAQKLMKLMEALQARYGEDEKVSDTLKSIDDRLESRKTSYPKLKILNLSSKGINDLSEWKTLADTCPNVEYLEICDNLIGNWDSIGKLCLALKKLARLDISRNPLAPPTDTEIDTHKNSFTNLQHFILGGVKYDWPTILKASLMWPQIVNLTIPFNNSALLSSPLITLQNLTIIDLEKNQISSWDEVLKLDVLKGLEQINLCGNFISSIRFPIDISASQETSTFFSNLIRLNISENTIGDWLSVSELSKLQKMTELRVDMNPFLNENKRATNRQLIIARIEKLSKLEGVDIPRQERRDSELDYVKLFGQKWQVESDRISFISDHPRYPDLVKKYGQSEKGERVSGPANCMKSSLINLIIIPESALSYKECEKKILKTMTVQKLKGLLQRMFKIPAVPISITVVSCQNARVTFPLDNDFIELGQYSIEDGDTLRINW